MAEKFKIIFLDIISFFLTILALIFHLTGYFIPKWWTNTNRIGTSYVGMTSSMFCEVSCVEKSALDIQGEREWIFASRIFEAFGILFVLMATLFAVLMIIIRKRAIHTALVYIHGAAAVFILTGVFIFVGLHSKLDEKLGAEGKLSYPFGLCLVAAITCIAASIVTGYALSKHLLEWDDDDEDALE